MEKKIKIGVTTSNELALKTILGVDELPIDEKNKVAVEYTAEKDGEDWLIKFSDDISATVSTTVADLEGFELLKEYKYDFLMADGSTFSIETTYNYGVSDFAYRLFYKNMAKTRAVVGGGRNSASKEIRDKLAAERAKYKAQKANAGEVSEDSDF